METTATETADIWDQITDEAAVGHLDGLAADTETALQEVVEDGSFVPDSEITVARPLTVRERLTGRVAMTVNPVFTLGLMLGAALERDVPMDSAEEDAWRRGEFTLPDQDS